MKERTKLLLTLVTSVLTFIMILILSTLLLRNHTLINQTINTAQVVQIQPEENDSVTVNIIKNRIWILVDKSNIDQHSAHVWKLKSGNYVIHFNYMPDDIYFKYNIGEVVPNNLILQLLSIDQMIHETYNLHKQRQGR